MKTQNDVVAAGGILISHLSGSTWNDGGRWNTWVYVLPETQEYIRVHQPTDYIDSVEIDKVSPKIKTVVTYETSQ